MLYLQQQHQQLLKALLLASLSELLPNMPTVLAAITLAQPQVSSVRYDLDQFLLVRFVLDQGVMSCTGGNSNMHSQPRRH